MELRRLVGSSDLHRKGSWHQILRLWRSRGHQEATRRAPRSSRGGTKRLPRGSFEALWELFGVQEAPRNLPKPRSSIHSSFSEPPRGSPEAPTSRSIDFVDDLGPPEGGQVSYQLAWARPGRAPGHARARASLYLYYKKTRSKRRCSLLTGGSADFP